MLAWYGATSANVYPDIYRADGTRVNPRILVVDYFMLTARFRVNKKALPKKGN